MPLIRTDEDGAKRIGETRVTLETVITHFFLKESPEEIAEQYPSLELEDIYELRDYYHARRDEVDAYIAQREYEAGMLRDRIERVFPPTGLRDRLLARRASG
jgi:uncharacterized protein (DUF433 family)